MKTFNTKLTVALFTTLVLTGCMPDSLTKFKKEEPTKAPAATAPAIVDSNGNGVDPNSLVFPSKFYFISEGSTPTIERNVGSLLDVTAITDGTLTDPTRRSILFLNCKLVLDTGSGTMTTTLPAGLTFDNQTCRIYGTPSAVHFNNDGSAIQYTAEMSYKGPDYAETGIPLVLQAKIKIGIYEAPADLSYTTRQLIEVNSNTSFIEGETLFQPIVTPALSSVTAKILRKIDTDKLSIETSNGNFLPQAALDSGNSFASVKTSIKTNSKPNYYNIALTLNAGADMTNFPVNGFVYNTLGAKGVIVYRDLTRKIIYIRFLTPTVVSSDALSVPTIRTFAEDDVLDIVYPHSATPKATIDQIEASNMVLSLASAASFTAGHDITSDAFHSGYVYEQSGNVIKVDEINRTGDLGVQAINSNFLQKGQLLSNSEYYTGVGAQAILTATHDNLLVIERGVSRTLYANSRGSLLTYSISPALPAGLSLDTQTGNISGTATFMSPRTTYVVTATNSLGETYFAFDMEVRDYFTFAENSGAKSFITHKVGDYKNNRACRINASDIINGNSAALDIGCNLEAEERDLYYTALKLSATVGPGVCEYVSFTPFSFWKYPPYKTKRTIHVRNNCSATASTPGSLTELPKVEDYCLGNYANNEDEDEKPNCDEGAITVQNWTSAIPGDPCATSTTQTIQCGGKKSACLAGPVTSVITNTVDLDNGIRAMHLPSYAGATTEWEIASPFSKLDITNLRNANGIVNNACSSTRADASAWANLQKSTHPTSSPFGGESPFYEFHCVDAANDLKARIRVTIRDWDRTFKISDRLTENVPGLGAPAIIASNRLMNADPVWNNNDDWDNAYTGTGSLVQATSCGAVPADSGTCSSTAAVPPVTRATCVAAGETWISSPVGVCSAGGHTTEATCITAGETWTFRKFPFPKENL